MITTGGGGAENHWSPGAEDEIGNLSATGAGRDDDRRHREREAGRRAAAGPPRQDRGGSAAGRAGGARGAPARNGRSAQTAHSHPGRGPAPLGDPAGRPGGSALIRYFDASALVKRYVEEPHGEAGRELLDGPAGPVPATGRLSEVEIASALVRRWREGDLSEPELDRALTSLNDDFTALTVVELVPEITALARRLLLAHPLRAGDAIQLASSAFLQKKVGRPIEFLAFDGRLNAAAAKEGLRAAPS